MGNISLLKLGGYNVIIGRESISVTYLSETLGSIHHYFSSEKNRELTETVMAIF